MGAKARLIVVNGSKASRSHGEATAPVNKGSVYLVRPIAVLSTRMSLLIALPASDPIAIPPDQNP
jgi:hypothetical protein